MLEAIRKEGRKKKTKKGRNKTFLKVFLKDFMRYPVIYTRATTQYLAFFALCIYMKMKPT
jgi:hypothetical protein